MIDMEFTPRNVSKFVVRAIVAGKANSLTKQALVDYTSLEKDDLPVTISGSLVGWYAGAKAKPYIDTAVDKIADKIAERKAAKIAKKETTE